MTGKQIKELRLRLGLSREQFAKQLGVNRNAVWRWEQARGADKRKPSRLVILAIKQRWPHD